MQNAHRRSRAVAIYAAVMLVALVIVAVGTTIWLTTDNYSGTNVLATDEQSILRMP